MILPVTAYGLPILRKVSKEIGKDYPNLDDLIGNMFETMNIAEGVGLAAPQVNLSLRLFVIDATSFADKYNETKDFKKAFINPNIIERGDEKITFSEGCLSIPGIYEELDRPKNIRIQYYDENFEFHDEKYNGIRARIMQHEFDHLEGILFVDHLSFIRKTLLKGKLSDISKGNVKVDYKMIFPAKKKKYK